MPDGHEVAPPSSGEEGEETETEPDGAGDDEDDGVGARDAEDEGVAACESGAAEDGPASAGVGEGLEHPAPSTAKSGQSTEAATAATERKRKTTAALRRSSRDGQVRSTAAELEGSGCAPLERDHHDGVRRDFPADS
jgi:hypothetical protein